ncbi:MAG TPA: glycosyltransferase family 4 protein [Verrucomicrobiae bacterium]|jgi:glycosyltransferase involved in cell wall biosynthesis|nr:glycosyltransferase family 4 protein [Verrucomicrobiae bacterium]
MKALFVHQYLGAIGGAETDILLGADSLEKRGHSTGLLYASRTGRGEEPWNRTFSASFPVNELDAALEKFAPDLIYFHSLPDLGILERLLDSGIPMVRRVHDHRMYCMRGGKYNYFTRAVCSRPASLRCVFPCLGFVGRNPTGSLPLKWVSYSAKLKEIRLNQRCARLVVYSDYQKEELIRNGFDPEKIEVHVPVHNYGEEKAPSSFSDRNLVLFVGQVIRGKGVDLLLRALAKVNVPFEASILGEGNHRQHCERLCAKLGLRDRVRFHGFVPSGELKNYYQEASLLAVSSVWPEPFGLVGQEAMFHGLPVVGFDAGGIREWLLDGENGFLVRWKDTDAMAWRIEQLLRDKELARKLGARGRELVSRQQVISQQNCPIEQMLLRVVRESRPMVEPQLRVEANATRL